LNDQLNKGADHAMLISWIKSKYALYSPATFVEPPYENQQALQPGNAENGKAIFELSCQYCHKAYGCSDVVFDDSRYTFNKFSRDFEKDYWWLYQIIRHGQYSYPGHEPYMPHYTAERMTDQQVEDLKAYFLQRAS
jgi:mono/diheme cytochrome c family protein